MPLALLPDEYAVCQLQHWSQAPDGTGEALYCLTQTSGEVSLVCRQAIAPEKAKIEPDWRAFVVQGKLDFALIGILAKLTTALADHGVSVFAISTFDTDYLLVRTADVEKAKLALAKVAEIDQSQG
ncbi:MAG: amino acid-binding protein [Robiginitomaculum sp.]|nr:MAG: amino acid-binding protein [Robiginitomaculum sp.]